MIFFSLCRSVLDEDFTVPSETMFIQLEWMTFPERVVYHKAIQVYKTVCGDAPDYLTKWFCFYIWDSFKITKIIFQLSVLYTKTQHRISS